MKTLILGGSSDMAIALVNKLLKEGETDIILAARNSERLGGFVKNWFLRFQVEVYLVDFNAGEFESHKEFLDQLPFKPSTVVSYLGYLGEHLKAENDFHESLKIYTANLLGLVSIFNLMAKELKKEKNTCLVGVSSVAGERGRQSNYLYGSAKAGASAYLSGLRNRYASTSLHIATIKPGFVHTSMTANLDLPGLLTAEPEETATAILRAIRKRKNIVYVRPIWRYIMLIIRLIPEPIFKKLKL